MDVMMGLAAVSHGIGVVKGLLEIKRGYDTAELKLKLADVFSSLADARTSLTEAKAEIDAKQAEIDKLRDHFKVRAETIECHGHKYEKGKDGKPVGLPYCPRCEGDGRMLKLTPTGGKRGETRCPQCKSDYAHIVKYPYPAPDQASGDGAQRDKSPEG